MRKGREGRERGLEVPMLSNETSLTWPHETISATENHRKQSEGETGGEET